jgi:hypothetical protein
VDICEEIYANLRRCSGKEIPRPPNEVGREVNWNSSCPK